MRNTIFLSLATAYLESWVLHSIEMEGVEASSIAASVYLAPNALGLQRIPGLPSGVLRGDEESVGPRKQTLD